MFRKVLLILFALIAGGWLMLAIVQQDSEIITEVVIDAPPEAVWAVMVDFDHVADWNPLIRSLEGKPEPGQTITVAIALPGEKPVTIRPVVVEFEPGRILSWRGVLLSPFLFAGEHAFRLQAEGEGRTRFSHSERFTGLLVGPLVGNILNKAAEGYAAMNRALKARVERAG